MTALTAAVSASATVIPVDTALTHAGIAYPMYYLVDDEVIRVVGGALGTSWHVYRGWAGTTAAAHDADATLNRYYPDAPTSGGVFATYDGG